MEDYAWVYGLHSWRSDENTFGKNNSQAVDFG